MSWGEIFFGFRGRLNRKVYWLGSLAVSLAGLIFLVLLSYLATGNAFAPELWNRTADNTAVWLPIWLIYYAVIVWPSSALAVKRLHDRGHSSLIWYIYFVVAAALAFIPAGAEPSGTSFILVAPVLVIGAYLFIQLGVLRGTPGPNAHGEDTLPADYYGGDYSFASLMLAVEGRITRSKWWQGVLIISGVMMTVSLIASTIVALFVSQHPGLEQNLNNVDWINSPEAQPILFKLTLWLLPVVPVLTLAMWSFVALGVKRLHDRGLSSWLILVVILPFVALMMAPQMLKFGWSESVVSIALLLFAASVIWSILQFGILKGEVGPDRRGPDSLAG